jgi:hypothetical protein
VVPGPTSGVVTTPHVWGHYLIAPCGYSKFLPMSKTSMVGPQARLGGPDFIHGPKVCCDLSRWEEARVAAP